MTISSTPALRTPRALLLAAAIAATMCGASSSCAAQAGTEKDVEEAPTSSAASDNAGPAGIVPVQRGFNASLATASQHDSSGGWSSVLTPNVAFRLNRHFSADAGVPIFTYINIDANVGTKAKPVFVYGAKHGVFGDTALTFHGDASPPWFDYNGTFSLALPSGNTAYGLGAGQVTYNLNNHIERSFSIVSPNIEVGFGDTSALVQRRLRKSYITVGPMAHFQTGASIDLPRHLNFEADVYEELPLAQDLIYSSTGKGKKKVTTSTNVGPAEDNGVLASLDIPLTAHSTLSGFYSRSIRDSDDTAGFSITAFLKPRPAPPPE